MTSKLIATMRSTVFIVALSYVGSAVSVNPPTSVGSYKVGVVSLCIDHPTSNNSRIHVWYPIDSEGTASLFGYNSITLTDEGPTKQLPLNTPTGPLSPVLIGTQPALTSVAYDGGVSYTSGAFQITLPVSTTDPFPLIVESHGNLIGSWWNYKANEVLASHGFIVMSVNHRPDTVGDLLMAQDPFAFRRDPADLLPLHTIRVGQLNNAIDWILSSASPFAASIDSDKIGLTGNSFGGTTTFQTAVNDAYAGNPRIKAIFGTVPAYLFISSEQAATVNIPSFFLQGSADIQVGNMPTIAYNQIGTPEGMKFLVEIQGAGHHSFYDSCSIMNQYLQPLKSVTNNVFLYAPIPGVIPFPLSLHFTLDLMTFSAMTQGCFLSIAPAQVAEVHNLYHVSFFKTYLAEDGAYQPFLGFGYASTAGLPVKYWTSEESSHIVTPHEFQGDFANSQS